MIVDKETPTWLCSKANDLWRFPRQPPQSSPQACWSWKREEKTLRILTSGDDCFNLRWLIIMAKTIAPQKSDGLLCFHSFTPPLFHTLLFSFSSFMLSVFKNTHTFVIFVWGMLREIINAFLFSCFWSILKYLCLISAWWIEFSLFHTLHFSKYRNSR